MIDWRATLLSQYANSPIIGALLQSANECIDPAANIDAFYQSVWNVDTATGHGLDVWGRIVGISRQVKIPESLDYFGFQADTPEPFMPFGSGVFYAGSSADRTYDLSDSAYRSLILFKAFSNIAATDIPTLNKLVNILFGGITGRYYADGYVAPGYVSTASVWRAHVEDLGNMQLRYVIGYDLNLYQAAIVNTPGVLPRPTGVKVFINYSGDWPPAAGVLEVPPDEL